MKPQYGAGSSTPRQGGAAAPAFSAQKPGAARFYLPPQTRLKQQSPMQLHNAPSHATALIRQPALNQALHTRQPHNSHSHLVFAQHQSPVRPLMSIVSSLLTRLVIHQQLMIIVFCNVPVMHASRLQPFAQRYNAANNASSLGPAPPRQPSLMYSQLVGSGPQALSQALPQALPQAQQVGLRFFLFYN